MPTRAVTAVAPDGTDAPATRDGAATRAVTAIEPGDAPAQAEAPAPAHDGAATRVVQAVSSTSGPYTTGMLLADRYTILSELGAGGFAYVFLARDETLNRDVAIKILHVTDTVPEQYRAQILARFQREAEVAATLRHHAVVQVFDIGFLDADTPFIVMERLVGQDMSDFVDQHGGMFPERLIPLFIDCLRGLGEAHELGIVHKDLKPSNLFLCEPGTDREHIKIVDFGIAHVLTRPEEEDPMGQGGRLTRAGELLGTADYMAPEYIEGEEATPAVDVYQMALTLIVLLTGQRMLQHLNMAKRMIAHLKGELELPEHVMRTELGPILERALARFPDDRTRDADQFADELSTIDASSLGILSAFSLPTANMDVPTAPQGLDAFSEPTASVERSDVFSEATAVHEAPDTETLLADAEAANASLGEASSVGEWRARPFVPALDPDALPEDSTTQDSAPTPGVDDVASIKADSADEPANQQARAEERSAAQNLTLRLGAVVPGVEKMPLGQVIGIFLTVISFAMFMGVAIAYMVFRMFTGT